MNSLTKLMLFSLLLILAGASAVSQYPTTSAEPKKGAEKPVVNEAANPDTSVVKYQNMGKMRASWYGPKFNGKATANGERYNQEALTAAHRSFRFGTLLRLTNPNNQKSVIVRVNDRGPYLRYRQLDISKAAARELGMMKKGVSHLKVEQVSLRGVNFPVIAFN
ncbi:MAG: septal ring lytic transglycosylase RlpA family protein [Ignavibacteria bacterium]|nr:septal ring lytic transglycosylase RlpA family protein [Ignavibacteria bacterium]